MQNMNINDITVSFEGIPINFDSHLVYCPYIPLMKTDSDPIPTEEDVEKILTDLSGELDDFFKQGVGQDVIDFLDSVSEALAEAADPLMDDLEKMAKDIADEIDSEILEDILSEALTQEIAEELKRTNDSDEARRKKDAFKKSMDMF
jgi:hypothetical protein